MKQKKTVSVIIILVVLVFVALYMSRATNVGRQPSEHEIERQDSGNLSAHTTYVSTLPVNASEANVTSADIVQEQLQANNQLHFVTDSENISALKVCISQWLQDVLTVNETMCACQAGMGPWCYLLMSTGGPGRQSLGRSAHEGAPGSTRSVFGPEDSGL